MEPVGISMPIHIIAFLHDECVDVQSSKPSRNRFSVQAWAHSIPMESAESYQVPLKTS